MHPTARAKKKERALQLLQQRLKKWEQPQGSASAVQAVPVRQVELQMPQYMQPGEEEPGEAIQSSAALPVSSIDAPLMAGQETDGTGGSSSIAGGAASGAVPWRDRKRKAAESADVLRSAVNGQLGFFFCMQQWMFDACVVWGTA
jgi:hypothetical protein